MTVEGYHSGYGGSAGEVEKREAHFSGAMIRLHFYAYRAVNERVLDIGGRILSGVANSSPVTHLGAKLRSCAPIDWAYLSTFRLINRVSKLVSEEGLWSKEQLKTNHQLQKSREIVELREWHKKNSGYKENNGYIEGSESIGRYLVTLIPHQVSRSSPALLPVVEASLLYSLPYWLGLPKWMGLPYWVGLTTRYILNYQLEERYHWRWHFMRSSYFRDMTRNFYYWTTNLSHEVFSEENVSSITKFEDISLKIFKKIEEERSAGIKKRREAEQAGEEYRGKPPLVDIAIASVAKSIARAKQADEYLEGIFGKYRGAAIPDLDAKKRICRTAFYEERGWLPGGIKRVKEAENNEEARQDENNLFREQELALFEEMQRVVEKVLDKVVPKDCSNFATKMIYRIQGKFALRDILAKLLSSLVVEQVADPHSFALAILAGSGREVADYELNGFGRKKEGLIVATGEKMIKGSLEKLPPGEIVKEFVASNLMQSPRGEEGVMQKLETYDELKKFIGATIYDVIKEGGKHTDRSKSKGIRESLQSLPKIGSAVTFLHLLCNGIFYIVDFYKNKEYDKDDTVMSILFKKFVGRSLSDSVADRTMELIYHPSWRFIILQLIEDITDHIVSDAPKKRESNTEEDLRVIIEFLIQHYSHVFVDKNSFTERVLKITSSWILSDEKLSEIVKNLHQPGPNILEDVALVLAPMIDEMTLDLRLSDQFRCEGVQYDGDDKEWEHNTRFFLNRAVEREVQKLQIEDPEREIDRVRIRKELIEKMIAMDFVELKKMLNSLPEVIARFNEELGEIRLPLHEDYGRVMGEKPKVEYTAHFVEKLRGEEIKFEGDEEFWERILGFYLSKAAESEGKREEYQQEGLSMGQKEDKIKSILMERLIGSKSVDLLMIEMLRHHSDAEFSEFYKKCGEMKGMEEGKQLLEKWRRDLGYRVSPDRRLYRQPSKSVLIEPDLL